MSKNKWLKSQNFITDEFFEKSRRDENRKKAKRVAIIEQLRYEGYSDDQISAHLRRQRL